MLRHLLLALCLVAGASMAVERSATSSVSHTLLRSGSAMGTYPSRPACVDARTALRATDAPTKTTGQVRYVCREDDAVTVMYGPNPTVPPPPTPVNCAVSNWGVWTAGAWSTCSNRQQSRTETRTRTVTTQPANGGAACPALTETRIATQPCGGPAILSWSHDGLNTDGFRINYGSSPTALTQTIQLSGAAVRAHSIAYLVPGTYYFSVKAYRGADESNPSNVVSKVIP